MTEWKEIPLGTACKKIGSGATPRGGKESYLEYGPIKLIRSQNIYNEGFKKNGLAFIDEKQAAKLDNVTVEANDVLLNITGDSVARACLALPEYLPARVNQHVAIIRPDPKKISAQYLRYFLVSPKMQNLMLGMAASGGTRSALTKGMIEDFKIPCPHITEQHAISAVLSALDDKIELNRKTNETLERMAQAVFKSWFVDFDPVRAKTEGRSPGSMDAATASLFPSRLVNSDLGEIPEGWSVVRLDDLLVLQRGFDLPATQRIGGKFPVIAASGPSGTHNVTMVKGPGIVTGRSGVLGKVFYVHEDFWPLNTALWIKEFKGCTPTYAYFLLRGLDFGIFNAGSAVPTLNRNHVHNLKVVKPAKKVVQAFEDFAKTCFDRIRANEEQSRTLASIRDALLPKLLSGELRVGDAEARLKEAV